MTKLTKREEEILQILWNLKEAFVKEIIEQLPDDPKPHYNTISTIVRLMEEKGMVGHKSLGGSHRYYPILKKEEYRKSFLPGIIKDYFDDSYKGMVTFFAKQEKLSADDLREILKIIEKGEEK
ncbi:MAG: BlaI/MecI/CopY family transcriptional regulator [Weeksellaceae bacterium]